MKTTFVLATLLILTHCKERSVYTGEIFTGKSYIKLGYDNIILEVTRYSSWNKKPVDSPLVAHLHKAVYTDSGYILHTRYFINTDKGQQYNFDVPGKMKVWLNTATTFYIKYEDGHFGRQRLWEGESCIESLDSLTLDLTDSLRIFIQKGSCLNFRINAEDTTIRVSLIRGLARIDGHYGHASMSSTLEKSGLELFINKKGAIGYFAAFDTSRISSWCNAGNLLDNDSGLNEILQKVGNWYNIEIVLAKHKNRIEKTYTPLSHLCSEPLDSVLKKIETAFNVKVKIKSESIHIYEN